LKESDYWKYLGVDESIILKLILKKAVGGRALDSIDSGQGQAAGSLRHSNELSGHKIGGAFRLGEKLLASQEGLQWMDGILWLST
jgi:hypothetical protein